MPGYAATLAALGDAELDGMLRRRPDLVTGTPPASFAELASRAGTPASLAAALRTLDLGALQLAELLAVVGLPTTVDRLARAAGPALSRAALRRGLDRLAELGIALPAGDGQLVGPRGLGVPFGRPGGLGPSVAELATVGVTVDQLTAIATSLGVAERPSRKADLVRVVAAALSDPAVVRQVLAGADAAARSLLEQALAAPGPITVYGVGYGRYAGYADAAPATWLLGHGLLLPASYDQFVVPREAVLALRGGLVFGDWPEEPALPAPEPFPDAAPLAGAGALRAVVAAEGIVTRLDRAPLPLIQAGTVAVRDVRRLAAEVDVGEDEVGLLIDLLAAAGIVTVGGPWEQRALGLRAEADDWLAASRARRWAELAVAWRETDLVLEDHLLARHGLAVAGADGVRPLAGRHLSEAAARRRSLLGLLAGLAEQPGLPQGAGPPQPAGVAGERLGALLAWRQPTLWSGRNDGLDRVVVEAAVLLGLAAAAQGRVAAGPAAAAWVSGAGPAELAAAMAGILPEGAARFLVAGDLTVVAPGGLAPAVEARLATMATRESGGGAATWRIDQHSVRRALDGGLAAADVVGFLRAHSDTPLPQALEYLVADVARRHGRVRVGEASTYLRGDAAVIAGLVRSGTGRRLGLRELAPGVAVTGRPQRELLGALRKAGESAVGEDAQGNARREAGTPVRYPARAGSDELARRRTGEFAAVADPARIVARLRASAARSAVADPPGAGTTPPGAGTTPAKVTELARRAAERRSPIAPAHGVDPDRRGRPSPDPAPIRWARDLDGRRG